MNPVRDLLAGIDPGEPLLEQMAERLRADTAWTDHVIALLESLPDDELVALNREGIPPDVDPRLLAVAEREDVGVVRLNFFSREEFLRCWRGGTLSPHYHRRSFTTRILTGSYRHLLFDNGGSLDKPELDLRSQEVLGEGQGYALDWREFHFVMFPADKTVTLTAHAPPSIPSKADFPVRSAEEVLRLRDEILASLTAAAVPAP